MKLHIIFVVIGACSGVWCKHEKQEEEEGLRVDGWWRGVDAENAVGAGGCSGDE